MRIKIFNDENFILTTGLWIVSMKMSHCSKIYRVLIVCCCVEMSQNYSNFLSSDLFCWMKWQRSCLTILPSGQIIYFSADRPGDQIQSSHINQNVLKWNLVFWLLLSAWNVYISIIWHLGEIPYEKNATAGRNRFA